MAFDNRIKPEIKRRTEMEEIGKILPAIFRSYLQREAPRVVEVLVPLWSHVVGKAVAQHSRPVVFERGTLRLAASCPSWGGQLRRMAEEIRVEVNRYLGSALVKKVTVRHGSISHGRQMDASNGGKAWTPDWNSATPRSRPPAGSSPSPRLQASPLPGRPRLNGSLNSPAVDRDLAPELARILEQSFAKYFSRATAGAPRRKAD